ncbi:MAG: hypothetical protein ACYCUZ_05610 [Cuniculiplasma sp.]|jgi:hypothetical protein
MSLSLREIRLAIRKGIDRFLPIGPGAGMVSAGIVILSGHLHASLDYVLLGIVLIWAGLAWVGYIAGGSA